MKRIKLIGSNLALFAVLLATIGCTRTTGTEGSDTSETKIDHLIIKEVFYIGHEYTKLQNGKIAKYGGYNFYNKDQYIVIYNPTDEVKYLDGMALAVHGIIPGEPKREFALGDDFRDKYFGIQSLAMFPTDQQGSGKMYPIMPGESKVIAAFAIDHAETFKAEIKEQEKMAKEEATEDYPYIPSVYKGMDEFINLSKADFEWTNVNYLNSEDQKLNNPQVKDMQPILVVDDEPVLQFPTILPEDVCIALIEVPWTTEDFRANRKEDKANKKPGYQHRIYTNNGAAGLEVTEVPMVKVIDCVTICPTKPQMIPCEKMDKGYHGVTTTPLKAVPNQQWNKYSGLAIARKWDGKKFVDGNNSTQDFEVIYATLGKKQGKPTIEKGNQNQPSK